MPVAGRPISAAGPTFSKMGNVAAKANVEAITRSTKKLGAVVDAQGSRFHIKGRGGKKVPLSAKTDVRAFNNSANQVVATGAVRGIPEGFWSIVHYGSGAHIIAPRGTVRGKGRRYFVNALKAYENGTNTPGRAVKIGPNFRPIVMHPGHGAQGRPWDAAMAIGAPLVAKEMAYEESRALAKTFIKSI